MLQNQAYFFISYLWVWNSHFKPLLLFLLTVCAPPRRRPSRTSLETETSTQRKSSHLYLRGSTWKEKVKKRDNLKYSSIHAIIKGSSWDSVSQSGRASVIKGLLTGITDVWLLRWADSGGIHRGSQRPPRHYGHAEEDNGPHARPRDHRGGSDGMREQPAETLVLN